MIKSIQSVKVTGRRVIVRAGFDVPVENGRIMDDTRIRNVLPTLNYLIKEKAKIIIVSHLGRPKGWDQQFSLASVAERLGELVKAKVTFAADDITKQDLSGMSHDIPDGSILFLENVRFYPSNQDNDEKFAEILAAFGDVFVNDAFSVAHRQEASTFGLAEKLPSYAGINFLKEIEVLGRIIRAPMAPFIFMVGGAKVEDKVEVIEFLSKHVQHVLVGGASANTFLKARGFEVGQSRVSDTQSARHILRNHKDKIILPVDVVVAKDENSEARVVRLDQIQPDDIIYDIGPETIGKYSKYIKTARTLVWNGPFGLFETPKFATGSRALAQVFASRAKGPAFGVIGGGETVELFDQVKASEFVDHISTGGGAMLEFLAGRKLPAIKALESK